MGFNEKRENNTKESKKILESNLRKLYKIHVNCVELDGLLKSDVGKFLKAILRYWIDRNSCLTKRNKPVYFLGTHTATKDIRNKTTAGVTNRWINYLCAVGLLSKTKSQVNYTKGKLKLVKKQYKADGTRKKKPRYLKEYIRPLNTFIIKAYNPQFFSECNDKIKLLKSKNITPGNISYNMLALNGFVELAEEVYLERRELSEDKKLRECKILVECMDMLIKEKGYTTKEELYSMLYDNFEIKQAEVKRLFLIFQNELWLNRKYKAPNKKEIELYKLKNHKYIILNK